MDLNLINKNKNIYEKMHFGALLTAGNKDLFNTMTIGWATTGVIWGKDVFIVYVRPSRYTYEFMEKNELFTISFYEDKYKKELIYLGTNSGRDKDKVKDCNFIPIEFDGSMTFEQASLTVLCKKVYFQDLEKDKIPEAVISRYYGDNCYHRYYIGEIINIKD